MALVHSEGAASERGASGGLVGLAEVVPQPGRENQYVEEFERALQEGQMVEARQMQGSDNEAVTCGMQWFEGEGLTTLRLGMKLCVSLALFIAYGASDAEQCKMDLKSWLLVGGIVMFVVALLCLAVTTCFHKLIFHRAPASSSPGELIVSTKYLNRASWASTGLAAMWGLVWSIIAVAKLKKGSKSTCGSAFTAMVVMVAINILVLLFFLITVASYYTSTDTDDDEPGVRPPSDRHKNLPPRPSRSASPPQTTLAHLQPIDRRIVTPTIQPVRDPNPLAEFHIPMAP
eukprot:TRINITY_DN15343_c0_g1_i1.p1 TRINITY_DN15343_c0_g1~~TRINITY_DN15343_c0_g1_i1.p1  ORF type:complete len:288 (+),score=52.49 TRINITY_DN15343_c0_g1_i1:187-1050(+)